MEKFPWKISFSPVQMLEMRDRFIEPPLAARGLEIIFFFEWLPLWSTSPAFRPISCVSRSSCLSSKFSPSEPIPLSSESLTSLMPHLLSCSIWEEQDKGDKWRFLHQTKHTGRSCQSEWLGFPWRLWHHPDLYRVPNPGSKSIVQHQFESVA